MGGVPRPVSPTFPLRDDMRTETVPNPFSDVETHGGGSGREASLGGTSLLPATFHESRPRTSVPTPWLPRGAPFHKGGWRLGKRSAPAPKPQITNPGCLDPTPERCFTTMVDDQKDPSCSWATLRETGEKRDIAGQGRTRGQIISFTRLVLTMNFS